MFIFPRRDRCARARCAMISERRLPVDPRLNGAAQSRLSGCKRLPQSQSCNLTPTVRLALSLPRRHSRVRNSRRGVISSLMPGQKTLRHEGSGGCASGSWGTLCFTSLPVLARRNITDAPNRSKHPGGLSSQHRTRGRQWSVRSPVRLETPIRARWLVLSNWLTRSGDGEGSPLFACELSRPCIWGRHLARLSFQWELHPPVNCRPRARWTRLMIRCVCWRCLKLPMSGQARSKPCDRLLLPLPACQTSFPCQCTWILPRAWM